MLDGCGPRCGDEVRPCHGGFAYREGRAILLEEGRKGKGEGEEREGRSGKEGQVL